MSQHGKSSDCFRRGFPFQVLESEVINLKTTNSKPMKSVPIFVAYYFEYNHILCKSNTIIMIFTNYCLTTPIHIPQLGAQAFPCLCYSADQLQQFFPQRQQRQKTTLLTPKRKSSCHRQKTVLFWRKKSLDHAHILCWTSPAHPAGSPFNNS